jgi:hypothetical protein
MPVCKIPCQKCLYTHLKHACRCGLGQPYLCVFLHNRLLTACLPTLVERLIPRAGQNRMYGIWPERYVCTVNCVHTVFLAGRLPIIRSSTMCIYAYTVLANLAHSFCVLLWSQLLNLVTPDGSVQRAAGAGMIHRKKKSLPPGLRTRFLSRILSERILYMGKPAPTGAHAAPSIKGKPSSIPDSRSVLKLLQA